MTYDIAAIKAQTDLLALIEPDTTLRRVAAREYAGPCPKCAGVDRFRVNLDKGWFCRQCLNDARLWHDEIDYIMWRDGCDFATAYNRLGGDPGLTVEQRARMIAKRDTQERKRQDDERREREQKLIALNAGNPWEEYHQNLDKMDKRQLWRERGLIDEWIDYYQVGYRPDTYYHGAEAPALSIPIFEPYNYTSLRAVNVIYRILDAPNGDKYRPHMAGLGKPLYRCDQFGPPVVVGDCLIVEGEIKAMVTYQHLNEIDCLACMQVVGIAGKSMADIAPQFEQAGRIWICLDPDATEEAERLAEALGAARCRIIDLPAKIDDMLVECSLVTDDLAALFRGARRA